MIAAAILGLAVVLCLVVWAARGSKAPEREIVELSSCPSVLAGLRVVRLIAEGGMGAVFEAEDPLKGRKAAVKRVHPDIARDPDCKAEFLKEAAIVSALHHPNIVELYSVSDTPGELCLVFEYIQGKTLAETILSQGRLPVKECALLMAQICSALEYSHSQRVLHRDLKPSNIMIDGRGTVKVMDFGIARQAKATIARLTGGQISGTLSYMSPEQHLGEEKRPADIYSLGVSLYEMLCGSLPFKGPPVEYLRQKEAMDFTALSRIVSGLPPGADDFMARCLAADPNQRFGRVPDLYAAFEKTFG